MPTFHILLVVHHRRLKAKATGIILIVVIVINIVRTPAALAAVSTSIGPSAAATGGCTTGALRGEALRPLLLEELRLPLRAAPAVVIRKHKPRNERHEKASAGASNHKGRQQRAARQRGAEALARRALRFLLDAALVWDGAVPMDSLERALDAFLG